MNETLHFEDFSIGRVFDCGTYNLTKEEVFEFAGEFDPQPHHLDEGAANQSMLKGLSASGWHVCAIAMRLLAEDRENAEALSLTLTPQDLRTLDAAYP